MEYTIETDRLTRRFGTQIAVDHITFSVRTGEIFGFLGANGAGKTTAMRMLCGLLTPTSGNGKVAGFDILKQAGMIRSRIGYMSQKFSLYTDFTVAENMRFYGSLYGLSGARLRARMDAMAGFLDMNDLLQTPTADIPWGWQQRLSLACANLHEPLILFLDEPTGSVDPLSRRNFWDLIQRLAASGTTIFVTTHHMDEAEYCQRISIMVEGKIAVIDSPHALKQRYGSTSLQDVFIRLVKDYGRASSGGEGKRP
jgi:ABC-2 type transport system ATP-binding protein